MKRYLMLTLLMLALATPWLRGQTILMRVPDTTAALNTTLDIPVYADSTLTGKNVLSYLLQFSFNQTGIQFIGIVTTGTISEPFGAPAVNSATPGMVTLASAGTSPLSGKGKFIYLRFKGIKAGGSYINFTGPDNNYFNEGTPVMSFHNGSFYVPPPPSIYVSPDNGLITKGEQLQFDVSGGAAPYQWSVTNPAVAGISTSGLLTGTQAGFTRVAAQDNGGLKDTTGLVEIRAMRLSIPTNLSQWQGMDIDVPVNTTDLSGLGILAGNFAISFSQYILTPVGIVQAGTILAAYPAPVYNTSVPGSFSLSFAGSSPLAGSGTLIYVRFHVSTQYTGGTYIDFTSGLFNEDLSACFTSGYFTTINLPMLSVSPSTGSLVAGETQQFTVNGGANPPVTWTCSDTSVATISPAGLLTTKKGGTVHLHVTDNVGATAVSGDWLVYDTRVYMPDTTTCAAATVFYYPVRITALPAGQSVVSVQGTCNYYNTTYLDFQGIETSGTLTGGWTWAGNAAGGQISFAGSGTLGFSSPGFIVKLKFLLKAAFTAGANAAIQLGSITLNEGVPNPWIDANGYVQRGTLTVPAGVSIAANPPGAICSGMSVTFTATPVNGGIPSFQWRLGGGTITGATNQTYTTNSLANGDVISCVMTSTDPCATGSPVTSNSIMMTVSSFPLPVPTISGSASSCEGATGVIYSTEPGMTAYTWSVSEGGTLTSGAGTYSVTVRWNVQGSQWVSVNYANGNGCMAATPTVKNVSVSTVPAAAGAITGPATVFQSQSGVSYSIPTVALASTYTWNLPSGASIASGSGTNSIKVDFSASAASGSLTVYASNYCGNGPLSPALGVTVLSTLPQTEIIQNKDITAGQYKCYYATQLLSVGGIGTPFTVEAGASADLMSGVRISMLPVTQCKSGGSLHAWINTAGPYCTDPGLATNLSMGGSTIFSGQSNCYAATQQITVGGNGSIFQVRSGGTVSLAAGQRISMLDGSWAQSGSSLHAWISTNGVYCGTQTAPLVAAGDRSQEEMIPSDPEIRKHCIVYPNPTTGSVVLKIRDARSAPLRVELYSLTGCPIIRYSAVPDTPFKLDLGDQPAGLYLLRVAASCWQETIKVVKE